MRVIILRDQDCQFAFSFASLDILLLAGLWDCEISRNGVCAHVLWVADSLLRPTELRFHELGMTCVPRNGSFMSDRPTLAERQVLMWWQEVEFRNGSGEFPHRRRIPATRLGTSKMIGEG